MMKDLYNSIQEQFPNPYKVEKLYPIQHKMFNPSFRYWALKTVRGTLRIFKIKEYEDKILLEKYRFVKKLNGSIELKIEGDYVYILTQDNKYEDDYNYFKKLLDK